MNPAFYNPRLQKWQFAHHPAAKLGVRLYPIGEPEYLSHISVQLDDPAASTRHRSKKWWSRCLAQDVPEMGPAMTWIDNYFEESQIVATNTNFSDPTVGRLLAFGTAVDREGHGERVGNIVAFPRGEAGTDLVLSEMHLKEQAFRYSRGVELLVPQIVATTDMPAYVFRSPIRQVCFAGNPYFGGSMNPRLAVRISGDTTIFKQVRLRVPPKGQCNRLCLEPLIVVDPRSSGGSSDHVDIAFNPFYDRQFGTIDQKGHWNIWDIEGAYSAYRQSSGITLRSLEKGRITTSETIGEGWGRFIWGGDSNSILACDRQRAALFDIRVSPVRGSNVLFPMDRNRNWILDLHRAPANASGHEAFLLTSSDITWVDVRQPTRPLLSWPHRRHRDDVSLYLELFYSNNVTTAIIGSRMNYLTTCYEFSSLGVQGDVPTFLNDPYMLSPPYVRSNPSAIAINMAILPCSIKTSGDSVGPASDYECQGVRFFTGLSISKQLEISQLLYSTSKDVVGLISRRSDNRVIKSTEFVNDSLDDTEIKGTSIRNNMIITESGTNSHRRANLREIYRIAFFDPEEQGLLRTAQNDQNSIRGFMRRVSDILSRRIERADLGISSLLEVHEPLLLFDTLSDVEAQVVSFLDSSPIRESYRINYLLPTKLIGLPHLGPAPFSLQTLYENLVTTSVYHLPDSIPGRVRLRRERLARLISTHIFLASKGVSLIHSRETLQQLKSDQNQPSIYPSPESEGILAETDINTVNEDENKLLEHIHTYTHVQSRILIAPGLKNVLDSWKLCEDPASFEFFVDPEEGVPRYRKDRKKARKEKRLNSLHRNQSQHSVGPGASQPPPLLVNTGSTTGSQENGDYQNQSQLVVMSQVESGRHGGRKPQKKRRTGF